MNSRRLYWDYIKPWWTVRNDPNVLLLHYADMKKDLRGGIQKLAEFLEVDLTDDEFEKVHEKCSLPHMKTVPEYFRYTLPLNGELSPDFHTCTKGIIRNARNGDGKITFTEEQSKQWTAAEESEFPDEEMRNWARNGGEF